MIAAVGLGYDRIISSSEVAEEVLTGKMPAAVYAPGMHVSLPLQHRFSRPWPCASAVQTEEQDVLSSRKWNLLILLQMGCVLHDI